MSNETIFLAHVSTEEQKGAGISLPAQTSRLKTYCENKGFEVLAALMKALILMIVCTRKGTLSTVASQP